MCDEIDASVQSGYLEWGRRVARLRLRPLCCNETDATKVDAPLSCPTRSPLTRGRALVRQVSTEWRQPHYFRGSNIILRVLRPVCMLLHLPIPLEWPSRGDYPPSGLFKVTQFLHHLWSLPNFPLRLYGLDSTAGGNLTVLHPADSARIGLRLPRLPGRTDVKLTCRGVLLSIHTDQGIP